MPEDPTGSTITAGPYQGFRGIITPYNITVTARSRGGAEVRHAPDAPDRRHPGLPVRHVLGNGPGVPRRRRRSTSAAASTPTATCSWPRPTADTLTIAGSASPRSATSSGRTCPTGWSRRPATTAPCGFRPTIASLPANNVYRNLARTEGSLTGTIPPSQIPAAFAKNSAWVGLSMRHLCQQHPQRRHGRDSELGIPCRWLDLPIVAEQRDGVPDAQPIDLIRRPAKAPPRTPDPAHRTSSCSAISRRRACRILLSDNSRRDYDAADRAADASRGDRCGFTYWPVRRRLRRRRDPRSARDVMGADGATVPGRAASIRARPGQPLINGVIKIEMQRNDGTSTWHDDVTAEILGLGITGKNIADIADDGAGGPTGTTPPDACGIRSRTAISRPQRVRDVQRLRDVRRQTRASPRRAASP